MDFIIDSVKKNKQYKYANINNASINLQIADTSFHEHILY